MYYILERIKKISDELKSLSYSNKTGVEGFHMKSGKYSDVDEVDRSLIPWREYNKDDFWGGKDVYGWFRTFVKVPPQMAGKKFVLLVQTGEHGWVRENPQFLIFIDGRLVQGLDANHREIVITEAAEAGYKLRIDLQAYSGMGGNKFTLKMELAVVEEEIKNLYYDIRTPLLVAENLEADDKKRIEILGVLNETVNLLDLRHPYSTEFFASVRLACEFIEREFYIKMCGYNEITATCVGHTHIDVAWLWTLAQTREKVIRSFSTVLELMKEYPEYVFMSSQPQLYKFIKEDASGLYEQIKERVRQSRWEAEGAMWLEVDCNLASGESFVRQLMFGTRFFREEFGVENSVLWLPDVFGYSAALPQLLKKSGIDYFMTTKISWNQFNRIPCDTFAWRGIDGSEVLTHFITTPNIGGAHNSFFVTYNGCLEPYPVMGAWKKYQQKNINDDILICFGYGDGGGGPTREMLEYGRRMSRGIPGCPHVKMGKVADYFKQLEKKTGSSKYLPRWVGELYLEFHRGTYTSMARNKRYNRKSELLYQDIEFLSGMAREFGKSYPQKQINEGWEMILLNQFHDILPGSSIKEVYEVSKQQYEKLLSDGKNILDASLEVIAGNIAVLDMSVIVLNTLSYDRDDIAVFTIPESLENPCAVSPEGERQVCQVFFENGVRKALFFAGKIPAKGYCVYKLEEDTGEMPQTLFVDACKLENDYFRIELDEKGTICMLFDKKNKRQVLKAGQRGNMLQAFEDKPMGNDNWDIDIYYQEKMWEADDIESIEVIETGPVRGGVEIRRKFGKSLIVQKIYIYRDIARMDFDTYIDWKEDQVLLKASFPVDINADKATYEIQYGNIERPTHWNTSWDMARFEVCGHKWADVSEEGFGVSLLNDCKYGHDIKDGNMRLTLIKSGNSPNREADREEHRFIYSIYPHSGDWRHGNTVQMAYNLNIPLYTAVEKAHMGSLPERMSFISVDSENVILEVVKKAEDSDNLILRLYEYHNRRTDVKITFYKKLETIVECNLMEEDTEEVRIVDTNSFEFVIKPYEIKTFKVKLCGNA